MLDSRERRVDTVKARMIRVQSVQDLSRSLTKLHHLEALLHRATVILVSFVGPFGREDWNGH